MTTAEETFELSLQGVEIPSLANFEVPELQLSAELKDFGFLANRRRATLLPLCFQLLGPIPQPQIEPTASATERPSPLYRCPKCGGTMVIIQALTAAQILLRSPPSSLRAA